MAISFVSSVGAKSTSGGSYTSSAIDTTGANLIVVAVSRFSGISTVIGLSDSKGNSYTALTPQTNSDSGREQLFYCINPIVGTGHTFTWSTLLTFSSLVAAAFSGTSFSFESESGSASSGQVGSIQPGSLTPSQDGSLVVSGIGLRGGNATGQTPSVNSGFSSVNYQTGVDSQCLGGGLGYLVQSTAGAVNPTWTVGSGDFLSTVMGVFIESGGGGGGNPWYNYQQEHVAAA